MQITDCIQNKLGSRYSTLMEYNRKNPAGSEPVRLLMINDFPSGFDSRNVELLQNILKNGSKCGIYVLLHYNRDIPFPHYENMSMHSMKKIFLSPKSMSSAAEAWHFRIAGPSGSLRLTRRNRKRSGSRESYSTISWIRSCLGGALPHPWKYRSVSGTGAEPHPYPLAKARRTTPL